MSNHDSQMGDWDDETSIDEASDDDSDIDEYKDKRTDDQLRQQYIEATLKSGTTSGPRPPDPAIRDGKQPKRRAARAVPKSISPAAFTLPSHLKDSASRSPAPSESPRSRTLSAGLAKREVEEGEKSPTHRSRRPTVIRSSTPKSLVESIELSTSVPDSITAVHWARRARDEAQPHSWINTFMPTVDDDIQRWIAEKAPQPFDMRTNRIPSPMKPSNNIVEEYLHPNDAFRDDYSVFKNLSDGEKQAIIRREAEEYGMEKPQGYSVSFHYNPHVEYHHFGSSHPMKPWRLTLTKQLVLSYGLEYTMDLHEPRPATFDEIAIFHDREYTQFLKEITPQNMKQHEEALINFGFAGESNDCPVFEGLWNYVCLYGGASMHAAQNLLNKQSDIAINWSGGLHHARKGAASGFCYVNDIVLAIQHLLTQHQRVLYIDIDVHHGDGVEAAFESTDRVFTLSYHKFGQDRINGWPFFPGTGNITETGPADPTNRGKGHALNIPIDDGIDDEQYKWLFKTVTGAVVDKYRPTAIVLQSGADSLGGDRLGRFNLNIKAHGFCIETVKNYGLPILLIGGGGYTPRNVARTWCHETSVCVGAKLHNDLPTHIPYIQAFQGDENGGGILYPDLHNTKRHDNLNDTKSLNNIVAKAMENLRYLEGAPSVVVNTMGISEEQLMKIREQIDREMEEEKEDRHHANMEKLRRTRERNTGGRGERGLR